MKKTKRSKRKKTNKKNNEMESTFVLFLLSMDYTRPYEKLIVWQESHKLCLLVYTLSKKFPSEEKFGLVSQMRRSSSSIPTNIAEGNAKRTAKDKAHFFVIASGSLDELHYQCRLSFDLGYLTNKEFEEINSQIHRTGFLLMKLHSSIA